MRCRQQWRNGLDKSKLIVFVCAVSNERSSVHISVCVVYVSREREGSIANGRLGRLTLFRDTHAHTAEGTCKRARAGQFRVKCALAHSLQLSHPI